jgi:signal transduction histidine kinase
LLSENGAFREALRPLLEGSQPHALFETRIRTRDPREEPVDVSVKLIRVGADRIVSITRDITERKRTELERELLYHEAVDAVRARDEFLSVASHELRTPLNTLQLQIYMLMQPPPRTNDATLSPEQMKRKLEMAYRQIERLTRLIAQIMDVSRINAGRLQLEREEIDLSAVVSDVVARLGEEAARHNTQIALSAPVPVVGKWDRIRLEQVLTNLLANAFKFGEGKPIEVTVEGDANLARLIVTDHGIGIAPEAVERIFHRYEQAISSRAFGGLGLGLYIVRQIVEAHGGTIRVESQLGAGSTFTVEIPKEQPPATEQSEPLS